MLTFTIKSIKYIDLYNSLYTNINANGIESTDMYTNLRRQNNGGKMNLKRNLNIKTININIKNLRKTNRLLIENLSTRKPGKKTPHSTRYLLLTPNR